MALGYQRTTPCFRYVQLCPKVLVQVSDFQHSPLNNLVCAPSYHAWLYAQHQGKDVGAPNSPLPSMDDPPPCPSYHTSDHPLTLFRSLLLQPDPLRPHPLCHCRRRHPDPRNLCLLSWHVHAPPPNHRAEWHPNQMIPLHPAAAPHAHLHLALLAHHFLRPVQHPPLLSLFLPAQRAGASSSSPKMASPCPHTAATDHDVAPGTSFVLAPRTGKGIAPVSPHRAL